MSDLIDTIPLMKWQAEQKGYTCNDCYLSMQNCHDRSICCEDETGLCDYFEEMPREDTVRRQDAIDAALTFLVEYCGAAFDEDMQKKMCERLDALPSAEPEPLSDAYTKAVWTWLLDYQIKAAELKGRYTPYEVLSWVANDWRTEHE